MITQLANIAESFAGSMIALVIYMHYDLEGWYEQRRIRRGQRIDEKLRRSRYDST